MGRTITLGDGVVRLDGGQYVLKADGPFRVRPLYGHGLELVEKHPPPFCKPKRFVLHSHDGKTVCMILEPAEEERFASDSEEFWLGPKAGVHRLFEPFLNLPDLRRSIGVK